VTERTVLLVGHSASRESGRVAPLLQAKGYRTEWCCPFEGQALPVASGAYAAAIVFGGVQSANDAETTPYLRQEIDWIGRFVDGGGRYLGICLGGQLLARALGAPVRRHPQGLNEIGYYQVQPTEAGRAVMTDPLHVYHWHQEGFDVPASAELLVAGTEFPNQAFRFGRHAYGLQFHPEVTPAVALRWMDVAADHLTRPGAQCRVTQSGGMARFDQAMHDWLDGFLDRWLGLVPDSAQFDSPDVESQGKAVAQG
jgi:GMP synthase (glutamine-hydrolysing)